MEEKTLRDLESIDYKKLQTYILKLHTPKQIQQEAIKWVKEDLDLLFHDGERGEKEKIVRDIIVKRWMKRLNITEENLK